jgi:hypothetical protein
MYDPARPRRIGGLLAFLCLAAAPPDSNAPIPLAVRAGHCSFVVPSDHPRTKYLLIVGSLSRAPNSHRVAVRTESTNDDVSLPLADDEPGPAWRRRINDLADRLDRARRERGPFTEYPPAADPPRQRDFQMFAGATGSLAPVHATLRGIGTHCLVYVDADYADMANLQPAVDEVIHVFDTVIFPGAKEEQGHCLDVDRDGRFTMLFSRRLTGMTAGNGALSGFVLGSDFYRDAGAPSGNRCDMLYLNTDLRPGPYLRTVLAHEYTHAVVFSEHVFGDYLTGARRCEEESWLNEGLAHLAEEKLGFGWGNLDYRVSAFLSAPWRYPLVVPDYYSAGLWRDPGCRGATYLFLHACAAEDAGLAAKLTRSNLSGVANLEAATRESFAALFRRWTVAVGQGKVPGGHDLLQPLGGRLLCGVRREDVSLSGGRWEGDIAGTAAAYLLLHSPGANHTRVTIEADIAADLQVTLLPLPPETPRLSLYAEAVRPGAWRLHVTADAAMTLEHVAWEKSAPAGRSEDSSFLPDEAPGSDVRGWFGDAGLSAGETRVTKVIELPATAKGWLFKVLSRDAAGHVEGNTIEVGNK